MESAEAALEKPAEGEEENTKSDFLAYTGAIGAAVFLGLADYLASLLGAIGISGIFAEWFGCIAAWILYHIYTYGHWLCNREEGDDFYMTKAKSMYYEVDLSDAVQDLKEDEAAVYSRARGKSLRNIPAPKATG